MKFTRLFDLFPYQNENYPQNDALSGKYDGAWVKFSTQKIIDISNQLAVGLMSLGLKKGDMIALMGKNSVEWILMDQAIQKMGGIVVPVYPTSSEADFEYICNHAEIKAIFLEGEELFEKVHGLDAKIPSLNHYYTFEDVQGAQYYKSLMKEVSDQDKATLKEIQDGISEDDLATIIYTSGTTGNPKGVMLSHKNIVSNLHAAEERLPVGKDHIALSFLPLSHIFERMINYLYFAEGISVYYAESLETIGENLKEVRPHVFTAVPRLLEKVFDKIQAKGSAAGGIKTKLFNWATKLALEWSPDEQNGGWYHFKLGLADKIVFSKIRNNAGLDRVIACASGSAALQARLARYFNGIGVPLVEGYGLTETSPVIAVNGFEPHMSKIGAVGKVIREGVVKIAEDGEILYKGPNVMMGYYKNPEMTKEVIDDEGWFHTGDIGKIDNEGFLQITDRKKEIFKTSGGKYIAPQVMENKFKESVFIEQIMVCGEYKKFPSALIVPNFEALIEWCKENNIQVDATDHQAIISNPKVIEKFDKEVETYNADFARYEKVKKFILLPEVWTPESGLVTPTLKLKRKVILQTFGEKYEALYAD